MATNDYTQKLITLTRVNSSGNLEVFYPKTVASQVYVSETKTLQDHVDDTNIHLSAVERTRLNATGSANGYALLDTQGFVPAANLNPSVLAVTIELATASDLIDTTQTANVAQGQLVWVTDASSVAETSEGAGDGIDTGVESGWAIFRKRVGVGINYGTIDGWQKVAEAESLDVVVDWSSITNKPSSSVADIDDAVMKKHSHANKAVLDDITDSSGDLYYGSEKIAFHSAINHFKVVAESDMATAATGMQENDFVFVTTGTFTMPADPV